MANDEVFRKCAWRLIPFMSLVYLVNVIDRTNAGFAALTMNKDLGFSPIVFGFGAGIFFVGYALFQVPANVILERMGAKRWIFCITATWGVLSASNAFVQTPTEFYLLRFLVGMAEAGFFPGMLFYLNYWFPRNYLARFSSYFMIANPLSYAIGGPLSSLILRMDGVAGLHGWQYLFLMEGLPAFFLAFVGLKLLTDGPASAAWLSDEEKWRIAARLTAEEPAGRPDLWSGLRDPRVLALGVAYFTASASFYGVGLWLPQIVKAMGFSVNATGFVVFVCYAASIPALIICGRSSSRNGERIWHTALPWLLVTLCLAISSLTQSNGIVLLALAIGVTGMFAVFGPFFTLPSSFLRGTAAAGGIALIGTLGNFGAFFGPFLIGVLVQGSGDYRTGFAADALGFGFAALVVLAVGRAMAPRAALITPSMGDAP